MFKFKFKHDNTADNSARDSQLLLDAMDAVISGNYGAVDTTVFSDPTLANKLNDLIMSAKKSNNNFVMRMNEAMEHIGDNSLVKEMIEQVNSQTSSIQEMNESSKNLESSIKSITEEVAYIKDTTQNAIEVSEVSVSNMHNSITAVEESVEKISSINTKVQDFHNKIEQIAEIIDMVKKLASQSSLLALNASIEAARAGEAGKGFAVVANQVKELSSNTSDSTETIVKYVSELQASIDELTNLVDNTTDYLKEGNTKVLQSVKDMNSMSENMKLINERINNIYEAVNTQSDVTNTFVKSIDIIASSYETLQQDCINTGSHLYRIGRYVDTTRSDMARGFSELTTLDWIRVFQIDHLIFTWRVYNNLSGFEQLKITQLNNPKGCKFGLWVGRQTDPRIVNNQIFKDLQVYHEGIHKNACDSWYAAADGKRDVALECFNKTFEYYQKFYNTIGKFKDYLRSIGFTEETNIVVFRK